MTLDEAIKHCEEVAEEHTRYNRYGDFESWNDVNCTECAKEHRQLANWLKELKAYKEQDGDTIGRQAAIEAINHICPVDTEYDCTLLDRVDARYVLSDMPSATPKTERIVQDFTDKCRECGKTAITRAENDEILNEAWRLLMNVTEGDGVSTEQANGMLKLMTFFFYKYHGLKKKPEWVENVEARIEESEENK